MKVAPRAGAWIETSYKKRTQGSHFVAPRAGAWIETCSLFRCLRFRRSPLVQGRGLKPVILKDNKFEVRKSPLVQGRGLKLISLMPRLTHDKCRPSCRGVD